MKSKNMKILNYWKPLIIAIVSLYGSITSSDDFNKITFLNIKHIDKLIHFSLYFILSISLLASLHRDTIIKTLNQKVITLIIVISYGLLMEVFQYYFTDNRSAEILDVFANTFGCIVGLAIFPIVKKLNLLKYL